MADWNKEAQRRRDQVEIINGVRLSPEALAEPSKADLRRMLAEAAANTAALPPYAHGKSASEQGGSST